MRRLTRYNRRIKLTLIKAMSVTCLFCLLYIPIMQNNGFRNDVGYYTVVLDGKELGAVNSVDEAHQAFTNARLRLSSESDSILYMNPDFNVYEQSRLVGTRMSATDIEDAIYQNLTSSTVALDNQTTYTVRINDFTVTVGSKDDVVKLIEGTKVNYDTKNEFQVTLQNIGISSNAYSVNIVKSGIGSNNNNIVAATLNGQATSAVTEGSVATDGLKQISFSQNVVVSQTVASNTSVMSVEDALAAITKEKEAKTIYTIVDGDCLSTISTKINISLDQLYALNPGITENSKLMLGQQLIVTVPTSELSVVTTQRATYEEDYNAEVQYVDNTTMFRGTSNIIQQGSLGHRIVTADVSCVNGTENNRQIIQQTIITASVPRVVEIGTVTPPTYIKPIYGGSFSSAFEMRWGVMHTGVDWACAQGTPVMSAANGTVIRAGYYSGYGNCVDISHGYGVVTRYGHLSKILVSVGQSVSQYSTIAYSGNTGDSTGPHLHFEIIMNGTPVNPLTYVNKY